MAPALLAHGYTMSPCRVEFLGDTRAVLLEDDAVLAAATGDDRRAAIIALWANLLANRRDDLAAVVAKGYLDAERSRSGESPDARDRSFESGRNR